MTTTHARDQIVESLFQVLRNLDGWASPPRHVGATPTQGLSIPTADIRWLEETSEEMSRTQQGSVREIRELTVGIAIYASSRDERAAFALAVEKAIALAEFVGRERRLAAAQAEDDDRVESPVWTARLVFVVTYHIHRLEPDVIITSG